MDNYKFPKYARLQGLESCIMIRTSATDDAAHYYRPCGEWGCTIKLRNYEYTSDDPCMKHDHINIIACSPEEFLKDNSYCISEYTAKLFDIAIQDIKETNPDFIDGFTYKEYETHNPDNIYYDIDEDVYYMHKVVYKSNNNIEKYNNWEF